VAETLDGRVALVTGGTGALGRAVVARLAARGGSVHVSWVTEAEATGLKAALGQNAGRVHLHRADVTDPASVDQLIAAITASSSRLDILTNIVGGFAFASLEETDPALWQRMLALNATSAFLCCRAAAPLMRRHQWGRIVNVAAVPALDRGAVGMSAYSASKAAVLNLTYSLAKELAPHHITANAVVPSIIDTPANRKAMPEADPSTWLKPDDIAEIVAFLVSEPAGIVTGTAVNLSAG
jgi:NAD(P)-dependent dehydrogenase (short-subunit alcohol dehydrogenase family)